MAIEFFCPHCHHQYKLKDELAGKTATCKTCREKITIPHPVTVPDEAAAEAAALAALADEPAKAEQDAASKLIDVECQFCSHKWTEPISRAGKNALCPNPECRQRIKIPEPKDEGQYDWRQTKTKGPSLAKQNQQKLEGVQDAAETKQLSDETVRKHLVEEEFEPRPLKQKVMFVVLALGLVAGLAFGGWYLTRSRTEQREDRLMQESVEELAKSSGELPKDEAGVFTAVMHVAAGEHGVRHDATAKFKEGMDQYAKARDALRPSPSPARNAAVADLAVATLNLGGTEEQAREQIRLRWMPDPNLKTRPNERVFTVFEELNKTLDLVQTADLEYRHQLTRRLTRELIKRGQPALAAELLPRAMFAPAEQHEARAVVAVELYRADRNSDLARKIAADLAGRAPEIAKIAPPPPAIQTLFVVLQTTTKPPIAAPATAATASDNNRYVYTGVHLLEDRPAEALKLAQGGRPEAQLRCLALCADWSADPAPALDAAWGVVSTHGGKKDSTLSPWPILGLVRVAAEKGKYDLAKQFADKIPDPSLQAWGRGEAIRARLAAAPKEKADEKWVELPDPPDPKKYRAGHALALVEVARQNARLSGDRGAEVRAVSSWAAPFAAFGKAGVALGLQDREK